MGNGHDFFCLPGRFDEAGQAQVAAQSQIPFRRANNQCHGAFIKGVDPHFGIFQFPDNIAFQVVIIERFDGCRIGNPAFDIPVGAQGQIVQ